MGEAKYKPAPKSDAMSAADAKAARLIIKEDICKYEQTIASLKGKIAEMEYYISESRVALADIDRREAGVAYPEPPKPPKPDGEQGVTGPQGDTPVPGTKGHPDPVGVPGKGK